MKITGDTFGIQTFINLALRELRVNSPEPIYFGWDDFEVVMNGRLRRCSGRCHHWPATGRILLEFSVPLFRVLPVEEIRDTVIHELAHAICMRNKTDKGHGAAFKRMCRLMGGSGERCLDVADGMVKRNLIKRWVLTKRSDPSKLFIRTRKAADDFPYAHKDALLLGVIQVDTNKKTVKWLTVCHPDVGKVNPMATKYDLVA